MRTIDANLKKGDRVWVQIYDSWGTPLQLRMAEVIALMQIAAYDKDATYVVVHYLDDGNKHYECLPLEHIAGYCEEGAP